MNDTWPQPVMQTLALHCSLSRNCNRKETRHHLRPRPSSIQHGDPADVRPTGRSLGGVVLPPSQRAAASVGAGAGHRGGGGAAGPRRRTSHCSCRRGEQVRQPGGGRKPAEEPFRRTRASRRSAGEGVKASASGPARTPEGPQYTDRNTQLRSIGEQVTQRRADREPTAPTDRRSSRFANCPTPNGRRPMEPPETTRRHHSPGHGTHHPRSSSPFNHSGVLSSVPHQRQALAACYAGHAVSKEERSWLSGLRDAPLSRPPL